MHVCVRRIFRTRWWWTRPHVGLGIRPRSASWWPVKSYRYGQPSYFHTNMNPQISNWSNSNPYRTWLWYRLRHYRLYPSRWFTSILVHLLNDPPFGFLTQLLRSSWCFSHRQHAISWYYWKNGETSWNEHFIALWSFYW